MGIWEQIHNPNFNYGEFAIIRSNAGLNSYKISVKEWTAKQWRENNPDLKGNIRDYASINELICLSNMENINAMLIEDKVPQKERLIKLNKIAIHQMMILEEKQGYKYLK